MRNAAFGPIRQDGGGHDQAQALQKECSSLRQRLQQVEQQQQAESRMKAKIMAENEQLHGRCHDQEQELERMRRQHSQASAVGSDPGQRVQEGPRRQAEQLQAAAAQTAALQQQLQAASAREQKVAQESARNKDRWEVCTASFLCICSRVCAAVLCAAVVVAIASVRMSQMDMPTFQFNISSSSHCVCPLNHNVSLPPVAADPSIQHVASCMLQSCYMCMMNYVQREKAALVEERDALQKRLEEAGHIATQLQQQHAEMKQEIGKLQVSS